MVGKCPPSSRPLYVDFRLSCLAQARLCLAREKEVESGHRHVIQQRLKLAGCWWKENNAEAMLGLRVARANQLWNSYWNDSHLTLN